MNFCKNNQCSKCGNCCTPFLPMTKNEVKAVKEYLKNKPQIKEKALNNPFFKDNNIFVRCCFYDSEKKECMIYPVRPLICKMYRCDQDEAKIEDNKKFVQSRSHYNISAETVDDFRSILFNDYRMLVLAIGDTAKKTPEELLEFFKEIGRNDVVAELEKRIQMFKEKENAR